MTLKLARTPMQRRAAQALVTLASAVLVACSNSDPAPTAPVTPQPATLALTGTASAGGALAARPVDARCAVGTGSTTTAADGTYTLSLTGGSLPCVPRVTAADGTVLHSLAIGSGATAKANLTPVSNLVVARLSGGPPANYYSAFDAAAAAALTPAKTDAAVTAVLDILKNGGIDFSALGNVLNGTLVAANGGTAGNASDQALDVLKARLASSGTTLAALTDTVARGSPVAPSATLSGVPTLPADLLLQPAAANCAAMRSGRYRFMNAAPSSNGQFFTGLLTLNASTQSLTDPSGQVVPLVANGSCRYTFQNGTAVNEIVVSQAGVLVARTVEAEVFRLAVVFPEQSHALADLAGEWNMLKMEAPTATAPVALVSATFTIDAAGVVTAVSSCPDLRTCQPGPTPLRFSANAAGGFDFKNTADSTTAGRVFMFRSGGGEPMLVRTDLDGSILFATRKRIITLPTVDTVSSSWSVGLDNQGRAASAITDSKNTILSVDSTAGTWVRANVFNITTGATVNETLAINTPRDGYNNRRAATGVTGSDGSVRTVSEFISLNLRGTGLVPVAFPATSQFVVSVNKP